MDQFEVASKGVALVKESLGRSKISLPESPINPNGATDTQRGAKGRQEPVFMNELMTRRDAFAAAALTGMLANPGYPLRPPNAAEFAFDYADAMLEARDRKP